MVHTIRAMLSLARPHDALPVAKEAALEALAIDETSGDAHGALGYLLMLYEWD